MAIQQDVPHVAASPATGSAAQPPSRPRSDAGRQHAGSPQATSDDDYQQRLGARLRAVRRARGMRLQDVEDRSEGRFKAVVIGSYERGDRAVSATRLAALASFYGVPITELLPDERWPRGTGTTTGLLLSVEALRRHSDAAEVAPLLRLVEHVQWLRGDYGGGVMSMRSEDLRTVAVTLGMDPSALPDWLEARQLLAP